MAGFVDAVEVASVLVDVHAVDRLLDVLGRLKENGGRLTADELLGCRDAVVDEQ